jgi:hypothetical protein
MAGDERVLMFETNNVVKTDTILRDKRNSPTSSPHSVTACYRNKSNMLYKTLVSVKPRGIILSCAICRDDIQCVAKWTQTVHSGDQLRSNYHGIHTRRILRHVLNPLYLQQSSCYRCMAIRTTLPGRRHPEANGFR